MQDLRSFRIDYDLGSTLVYLAMAERQIDVSLMGSCISHESRSDSGAANGKVDGIAVVKSQ